MNLPINFQYWILAFLPIGVLLFLMVKVQLASFKAAPIALLVSVIIGVFFYKSSFTVIKTELLKAIWSSLNIITVVFTAMLIYETTEEAKSFATLDFTLKKIAPNELIRILGLGMAFASFLQGATGFGVPIAVTSPLLIAMGVSPLWAVIIPLIGHCWAGTFGTLASAWLALISEAGADQALVNAAGLYAGIFLWIVNFIMGIAICWFYGKGEGVKKGFIAVLLFSAIQGGGQLIFTQINSVLATFLPACISLVAFIFISRLPMYKTPWQKEDSPIMNRSEKSEGSVINKENMKLYESFFPYIVVTVLTLTLLLIPPVKAFLSSFSFGPAFKETVTGFNFVNPASSKYAPFAPLSHASLYLLVSAIIGYFFYCKKGYIQKGRFNKILSKSIKKATLPSIAIISLIMMSKIMAGTGQISILAEGTAMVMGNNYIFMAPVIGTIGCFTTSSNTSANILFANFQVTMANILSLSPALMLGAQTAGASLGTCIAPSNITLGTTTANIVGREGEILKKLLPLAMIISLSFGLLLFISQII